jgi:hypothetical protein
MHTLIHIGFYISVAFAIMASGSGLLLIGVSALSLAAATEGVVITPRGKFTIPKSDIGIVWEGPLVLVALGLFWALVASGLMKLL